MISAKPLTDRVIWIMLDSVGISARPDPAAFGEKHMRTGTPIVYMPADIVFHIAADEQVIALAELYRTCAVARVLPQAANEVGRVIARPFAGEPGRFIRTVPEQRMQNGRRLRRSCATRDNEDVMGTTDAALREPAAGLIFVKLVEFDQQFGHGNDPQEYAGALEAMDRWLPESAPRRATCCC